MFDWAERSKSGVVLFIDEADAFLRPREEKMTTELRSAINTFLARTGEPSEESITCIVTETTISLPRGSIEILFLPSR